VGLPTKTDLCALLSKLPILSNSDLNLTPYSCKLAASCHDIQDSSVCENLLSLHPFPSSQEENVDEVTEETVVSKKPTQSLITSQVITSFSVLVLYTESGKYLLHRVWYIYEQEVKGGYFSWIA